MPKLKAAKLLKSIKTKEEFESLLKKAFKEISRVLKPNGIATIVYTHKSTAGWETLINSLLDSDLVVTASWPIDTEMKARLRAKESAALASSIYFVCRKMKREEIGWFNEIKDQIRELVPERLERLWQDGVLGADFFIAGIGTAIEIFGKYREIMDYEGNKITIFRMLEFVRQIVTDYAVRRILHNGIAEQLSPLTRFYLLWRWTYGEAKVHFDDARKLGQSTGVDISAIWNKGFIKKEKEFIRVLGPQDRKVDEIKDDREMIDVLHKSVLLWRNGIKDELRELLKRTGYGQKDSFYRVAQAIAETLPDDSKEKKLLHDFLSGKSRLTRELRNEQGRLF